MNSTKIFFYRRAGIFLMAWNELGSTASPAPDLRDEITQARDLP